jgi:imidazolonepropionase
LAGGDLVVRHGRLFAMAGAVPWRGAERGRLAAVEDGSVAVVAGRVAYAGADQDLPASLRALPTLEAGGRAILPGLVDCHTHVPFAAWRADEYAARLAGATYADQQRGARGGLRGIARSAAQLRAASDEEVLAFSRRRLEETLAAGTTTVELKSGYGGDGAGERRSLRLMAALGSQTPQLTVRTGLFLHARPAGSDRAAWLNEVLGALLPEALSGGELDAVDAFVEEVAFNLDEAAALLTAAQAAGLDTHLHAEQLAPSGAAAWAASHGVTSVDHLDHLDAAGVRALGRGDTVAVLLPGATFLAGRGETPPLDDLLRAGAAVALASDLNPGTSPVASLPEMVALACRAWGMAVDDAVAAVTLNAAAALGRSTEVGSLRPGMRGDLVLLDGDELALLAYRLGPAAVATVVAGGQVVVHEGRLGAPGPKAS